MSGTHGFEYTCRAMKVLTSLVGNNTDLPGYQGLVGEHLSGVDVCLDGIVDEERVLVCRSFYRAALLFAQGNGAELEESALNTASLYDDMGAYDVSSLVLYVVVRLLPKSFAVCDALGITLLRFGEWRRAEILYHYVVDQHEHDDSLSDADTLTLVSRLLRIFMNVGDVESAEILVKLFYSIVNELRYFLKV